MIWPPDSPWAPWWQMPKEIIRKMYRLVKLSKKDTVYELGCGVADAMVIAYREFGAKAIGIEIDPLRFVLAKINVWKATHLLSLRGILSEAEGDAAIFLKRDRHASLAMTNTITIIKDNFFNINLSDATVLIIYLVPSALKRLAPKFLKELQKGTRLISYKYKFPLEAYKKKLQLVKADETNEIYFYKII